MSGTKSPAQNSLRHWRRRLPNVISCLPHRVLGPMAVPHMLLLPIRNSQECLAWNPHKLVHPADNMHSRSNAVVWNMNHLPYMALLMRSLCCVGKVLHAGFDQVALSAKQQQRVHTPNTEVMVLTDWSASGNELASAPARGKEQPCALYTLSKRAELKVARYDCTFRFACMCTC